MTRESTLEVIEKELLLAQSAQRSGNEGMARVCARRASGTAISFWLQSQSEKRWGVDAMSLLHSLQSDDSIQEDVRDAARRLTTKSTELFRSPFAENPIDDARLIIHHLLESR